MAKYKTKIDADFLYLLSCFYDPASFFEFFNSQEHTKDGKPYELMQPFLDYSYSRLIKNHRCLASSRNCQKTTLLENETLQDALTRVDQKTGFIVPSEKHMIEVAENLVRKTQTYPLLKLFFKDWYVKNRYMQFHTGHMIEFRIMGHDYTGEKSAIALHCLDGDQEVLFYDGTKMKIKDVVENKVSKRVVSYSHHLGKIEASNIVNWFKFKNHKDVSEEVIEIVLDNNEKIVCTNEHMFQTARTSKTFIPAKYLYINDKLYKNISFNCKVVEWWNDNKRTDEYIRGLLLGDGSISRHKSTHNARIKVCHCSKQKEYLDLQKNMFSDVGYSEYNSITEYKSHVFSVQSRCSEKFNKYHDELIIGGKKTVTQKYLNKLTPLSIAVWYMDDGSLSGDSLRLATHGFSKEENDLISEYFKDKWDIDNAVMEDKRKNLFFIYLKDIDKFLKLIGPYIPTCMRYKLSRIVYVGIKSLNRIKYDKPVYDIEVETNHNYFINGILCHNCQKNVVDESQNIPKEYLQQLTPGSTQGFEYLIAGVSNNIRTTALWYGVADPMFVYLRYAMYEGPNWSDDMDKMMQEQTGGKETQGWKTLVEGRWGERAFNVFPMNKIWEASMMFQKNKHLYSNQIFHDMTTNELLSKLVLPALDGKFCEYILGVDVGGNSNNSPSEIEVWGLKIRGDKLGWILVYKLSLYNIGTVIQSEIVDYIASYFNVNGLGIDAQTVGSDLYRNLTEGKVISDPAKVERYKNICKPFIMNSMVVVDKLFNKQKQKDEELKQPVKMKATILLQELFRQNLIELPGVKEIMESFQAETWQSNRQRIGGMTYMNDKNEHLVDAARMAVMARWTIEQEGLLPQEAEARDIPGPNIRRMK